MATQNHEVPEWETPASAPKKGIFRKPVGGATATAQSTELNDERAKEEDVGASGNGKGSVETGSCTPRRGFASRVVPVPVANWFAGNKKRKIIVGAVAGLVLLVLILGIGLGVGLKKKSSKSHNLPLPSNTGIFTGDLTYYSPGPGYGACGFENTSEDSICAVSMLVWDAVSTSSNPNNNPLCGKMIRITRYDATKGGNSSVDVKVVDRCVGCKAEDLDLSLKMFTSLADESLGRVVGSWAWLT
ncbi:RlpA-like double-psi beta-barrel-protein domain-containing protein-containing protein [Halenospora varia]|nr:RlpA-like double-psi beta-barrel-protein domain-containing protein-containing protein [Halenospora varia]